MSQVKPLMALLTLFLLLLIGCASHMSTLPGEALAEKKEGHAPSSADPDSINRGRALAVTECATCHRFFKPAEYTPEQWHDIVRKMGKRASLSHEQAKDVLDYYLAGSQTTKD